MRSVYRRSQFNPIAGFWVDAELSVRADLQPALPLRSGMPNIDLIHHAQSAMRRSSLVMIS